MFNHPLKHIQIKKLFLLLAIPAITILLVFGSLYIELGFQTNGMQIFMPRAQLWDWGDIPFSTEKWQNSNNTQRAGLVKSFLSLYKATTLDEVEKLLGPADVSSTHQLIYEITFKKKGYRLKFKDTGQNVIILLYFPSW